MGHSISLFPECRNPEYDEYRRSWSSFLSSLVFPGSAPQRLSCNPEWCDIELCTNPNVMQGNRGPNHDRNADIHFSLGLAFMHLGDNSAARRSHYLQKSREVLVEESVRP